MNKGTGVLIDGALWACGKARDAAFKAGGLKTLAAASRLAGAAAFVASRTQQRPLEEAIFRFFPEAEKSRIRDIARRSIRRHYERHFETLFFGCLDGKVTGGLLSSRGMENIQSGLARGKGVILLLSHFGSFLLPLPYLGFQGFKVNQVTGRQRHSSAMAEKIWLWRKRDADRLPVQFIQVGNFLRPLYEALRGNEIVAIAFDGRDGAKWASTSFLGRRVLFSPGPFDLARRTGAVIIPTFVVRTEGIRHQVIFEPPFSMCEDPDLETAAMRDTQNFAALLEQYVRKYPCHFSMVLPALLSDRQAGVAGVLSQGERE